MNILVGYDGSNTSKAALAMAIKQAKAFHASIQVVTTHVGGFSDKPEDVSKAEQELEYTRDLCRSEQVECQTHLLVRGMAPGETLIQYAKEIKADLVVIGVRRRSQVDKLIFGSTAREVILNAPCPVLTVK
jgi:nucleotide-binding universal stress UspA family protein